MHTRLRTQHTALRTQADFINAMQQTQHIVDSLQAQLPQVTKLRFIRAQVTASGATCAVHCVVYVRESVACVCVVERENECVSKSLCVCLHVCVFVYRCWFVCVCGGLYLCVYACTWVSV